MGPSPTVDVYHRIMEWFESKGTFTGSHLLQLPCSEQGHLQLDPILVLTNVIWFGKTLNTIIILNSNSSSAWIIPMPSHPLELANISDKQVHSSASSIFTGR